MKKSLFLLPLLAGLVLCGCGDDEEEGANASLEINYELVDEALEEAGAEGDGYAALAEISSLGDYEVTFCDICLNRLNSESVPPWNTPDDEEVQVVQFKNATKGSPAITLPEIKASKVVITYLTSYSISASDFKVTFEGDKCSGKKGTAESTEYKSISESDSGTKEFDVKRCALTYTVNADKAGELVIAGSGQGARYVESIVIE